MKKIRKKTLKEKRDSPEFNIIEEMIIDKYKLDEESVKQAQLMAKIAKRYSDKYLERHELELELEILRDKLGKQIMEYPRKWDIEKGTKISEALINRLIVRSDEYKELYKELIKVKAEEKEWEGLFKASERRDNNIARLWSMWEKNYYV